MRHTQLFRFTLLTVAAVFLLACATKPSPEMEFWNTKFDDKAKAKLLVEVGTASYNNLVNDKQDVDPVDVIKEYFRVALKFDPGNEAAQQMLTNIELYRSNKMRESLTEARLILQKPNLKDDEIIVLLLAVAKANTLDPKSPEVVKLKTDTDTIRKNTISTKVTAAKSAIEKASKATTDASRDDLLISAWASVLQALKVAPNDAEALKVHDTLEQQIATMVDNRLHGVEKLIETAKFTDAKTQIDGADDLNLKLGGTSTKVIAATRYTLYASWAKNLFDKKDYPAAEARANQALALRRDKEMLTLLQNISDNRSKELSGALFVSTLAEIDKLIAGDDLVSAQGKLNTLAAAVKDADKQKQMDVRRKKISATVPELYTAGVQAYRGEKFDAAVKALSTVVAINPNYEQAKDFLDKAKQKKKLLDQY